MSIIPTDLTAYKIQRAVVIKVPDCTAAARQNRARCKITQPIIPRDRITYNIQCTVIVEVPNYPTTTTTRQDRAGCKTAMSVIPIDLITQRHVQVAIIIEVTYAHTAVRATTLHQRAPP